MKKNPYRFPIRGRRVYSTVETRKFHRGTRDPKRTASAKERSKTRRRERRLKEES